MRISGFQATSTTIQNPFTFYYVQDNDWSSSHSYQFWNKNFTGASGVNNDVTLKTIYSPSPSSYVEPKTAAFTAFTSTGGNTGNGGQFNVSGSWNKGWHFYTNGWYTGNTIFFNALGIRDVFSGRSGTGAIAFINENGDYWAIGSSTTANAHSIVFGTGMVYPQSMDGRSYGFSLWPVTDN